MRYLFKTNDTKAVEERFKGGYVFEKASAKDEILRIFDEENNFTIIIHRIDYYSDYLLKLLEDSPKSYTLAADYEYKISDALRARFDCEEELPSIDYREEAKKFLGGEKRVRYDSIEFYKELSKDTVKNKIGGWKENIEVIAKILNRILRCKTNIMWKEYYSILGKNFIFRQ